MTVQAPEGLNIILKEDKIENTQFSEKEIKRTRKKLKKAGIPKEFWFVEIYNKETGELIKYWI